MLLFGATRYAFWADILDGATGRLRWSRTFEGQRPETAMTVSGRPARCR